eukprot:TRINITY_DN20211_c0_g1_i1.p1 TRINITY_DN20211_c0_g1~~TRINITY_DN20211_c0_g1_i1.p1  ORF type:complete len:524 (+),score=75.35 TRINITY_DN20211_c0_g1_i1:62-1633(+)
MSIVDQLESGRLEFRGQESISTEIFGSPRRRRQSSPLTGHTVNDVRSVAAIRFSSPRRWRGGSSGMPSLLSGAAAHHDDEGHQAAKEPGDSEEKAAAGRRGRVDKLGIRARRGPSQESSSAAPWQQETSSPRRLRGASAALASQLHHQHVASGAGRSPGLAALLHGSPRPGDADAAAETSSSPSGPLLSPRRVTMLSGLSEDRAELAGAYNASPREPASAAGVLVREAAKKSHGDIVLGGWDGHHVLRRKGRAISGHGVFLSDHCSHLDRDASTTSPIVLPSSLLQGPPSFVVSASESCLQPGYSWGMLASADDGPAGLACPSDRVADRSRRPQSPRTSVAIHWTPVHDDEQPPAEPWPRRTRAGSPPIDSLQGGGAHLVVDEGPICEPWPGTGARREKAGSPPPRDNLQGGAAHPAVGSDVAPKLRESSPSPAHARSATPIIVRSAAAAAAAGPPHKQGASGGMLPSSDTTRRRIPSGSPAKRVLSWSASAPPTAATAAAPPATCRPSPTSFSPSVVRPLLA